MTEPKKKKTLDEMLSILQRFDDGDPSISEEDAKEAASEVPFKVDDYVYRLEELEAQIGKQQKFIAMHEKTKKTLQNKYENIQRRAKWYMEAHGFSQLPGNEWFFKITDVSDAEITYIGDPTPQMFFEFPQFINRKYSWKRNELKAAIKDDPEKWKKLGKPFKRHDFTWDVNKGVNK